MSGDICVRALQPGDGDAFRRLMTAFYRHAGNEIPPVGEIDQLFAKALSPDVNLSFLVAVEGGELVGMLSMTIGESSYKVAPFAWCDDFFVEPEHRGKGIGRLLAEKAAEVASSRGCSNILVGVGEDEAEARSFYESLGYVDMRCRLFTYPLDR